MKTQTARFFLFTLSLLITSSNFACTDFRLTAKDGTVLITRSLEFPVDMKSNLRSSPRDKEISAKAPNNGPGLSWKAKYGYLFVDAFNQDIVVDGMNEAGLSFEYLYLPGETQYPTVPSGKEGQSLPYYQLGQWILSNFKTVDEVKQALATVYVYQAFMSNAAPEIANVVFPLHAAVFEANGKGIVIEFVGGKVNVYDNIGIMTNSPTYDWQVTNLRNYLNLSPYNPKPVVVNGISYSVTGQGSGSVGLPGDVSPPSRFAKIAFLTASAFPANNQAEVLNLGEHIINNVDIPSGLARSTNNGKESADYTQWVVFKDLKNKIIYYRTYNDLTLRMVDMKKLDLSEKAPAMKLPLVAAPYIMDMTSKLANLPSANNHAIAKINTENKLTDTVKSQPHTDKAHQTAQAVKVSALQTNTSYGRRALRWEEIANNTTYGKQALQWNDVVIAKPVMHASARKKVAITKPVIEKLNATENKT